MAIADGRVPGRIRAEDCVFGRRYRDLGHRSEACGKQFLCWVTVVSAVRQEQINRTVDLIQEIWQCSLIADVILG